MRLARSNAAEVAAKCFGAPGTVRRVADRRERGDGGEGSWVLECHCQCAVACRRRNVPKFEHTFSAEHTFSEVGPLGPVSSTVRKVEPHCTASHRVPQNGLSLLTNRCLLLTTPPIECPKTDFFPDSLDPKAASTTAGSSDMMYVYMFCAHEWKVADGLCVAMGSARGND